jgi:hypothetical protein
MKLLGSIRVDPEHWRERAEEARHVAGQMSEPVTREMMLAIAVDYERLAEQEQSPVTSLSSRTPAAPAVKREAEEDWGLERWR